MTMVRTREPFIVRRFAGPSECCEGLHNYFGKLAGLHVNLKRGHGGVNTYISWARQNRKILHMHAGHMQAIKCQLNLNFRSRPRTRLLPPHCLKICLHLWIYLLPLRRLHLKQPTMLIPSLQMAPPTESSPEAPNGGDVPSPT